MKRRSLFKKITHIVLSSLFSFIIFLQPLSAAQLPMISDQEWKAMSPAQRQQYDQQFKKQFEQMSPADQEAFVQAQAEALFESLPPEQQDEVLKEIKRVEAMSEEEQKRYFQEAKKELDQLFGPQQE